MPKILDLIGQRFTRLTVISKVGSRRHNGRSKIFWQCRCECGAEATVSSDNLRMGHSRSCGCLIRDTAARIAKEHFPNYSSAIDLTGRVFGLLTAIEATPKRSPHSVMWRCLCSCGRDFDTSAWRLTNGDTKSCGCTRGDAFIKHGASIGGKWTPEYVVWRGILSRCLDPNQAAFPRYGGRGITVCERWRIFSNFFEDMGARPPGQTIERIDNERGYDPQNCRWATYVQQNRNRRNNRRITINGETMCVSEWAERMGVPSRRIVSRLHRGWTDERAVFTP